MNRPDKRVKSWVTPPEGANTLETPPKPNDSNVQVSSTCGTNVRFSAYRINLEVERYAIIMHFYLTVTY